MNPFLFISSINIKAFYNKYIQIHFKFGNLFNFYGPDSLISGTN